jgi:hypothetical protein
MPFILCTAYVLFSVVLLLGGDSSFFRQSDTSVNHRIIVDILQEK